MNPEAFPNRTAVSFGRQVPADTTIEETFSVSEDATVESVSVRIYRGAETSLNIRPQVETDGGNRFNLVSLVGKDSIDGDDDVFQFRVSEQIEEGDTVVVQAENTDPNNSYDFRANVEIDRAGGLRRLFEVITGGS